MPQEAKQIYQSFLLRCWLLGPATAETPAVWRFELREVAAEPREQRFANLEQLKEFIAQELAAIAVRNERDIDRDDGRKGEGRWHGE